jgi:hypothetical protein
MDRKVGTSLEAEALEGTRHTWHKAAIGLLGGSGTKDRKCEILFKENPKTLS